MPASSSQQRRYPRARATAPEACPCCRRPATFYWRCRCGFTLCQPCMDENSWGMTCNGITWVCPDCGASNSFGNQ